MTYPAKSSPQAAPGRRRSSAPLAAAATLAAAALTFTGVPLAQAAPGQTAPTQFPAQSGPAQSAPAQAGQDGLKRQVENLDRAPVAVLTDQGVTLSWRMLGLDKDSIGFHVIRDGVQLTVDPIRNSTMYVDPDGTASSTYVIKTVGNGNGQDKLTEAFAPLAQNYLAIKLDKPADGVTKDGKPYTYSANDASVADLDGDGKYEIIQTWAPSNAKDNSQSGYTGNVYVDAYRMDGTKLWRIDLGHNIRAGAHYTQLLAYDFDGDGKAELSMKTADGTKDVQAPSLVTRPRTTGTRPATSSPVPNSSRSSTGPAAPSWTRWPTIRRADRWQPGATATETAWTASSERWPTWTANTPP